MKSILLGIILTLLALAVGNLSHYSERMDNYNAHVCAVNGYEPDCKTLLK
jgi:uncharacterized protein YxeA